MVPLCSTYIYFYNNINPNNYNPSQDNIKALFFDNIVYNYNGKFINYTESIDNNKFQTIYNFNYYFAITDKTIRTLYNNDTFLCDNQNTINPNYVTELEHLYIPNNYQKLYFYNDKCMLSYPNLNNVIYEIIFFFLIVAVFWLCILLGMIILMYCYEKYCDRNMR
jgi:hypothetical protein